MRTAGLGLALVAAAQLTLLSSPAFADNSRASLAPTEESSSSGGGSLQQKHKTGWIVLGVGGALTVAGIVIDAVGTGQGGVSGQGGAGDQGTTNNAKTNFYWAGTALIVAGVVTGIVGGSMIMAKPAPPTGRSEDASSSDQVTKAAQQAAAAAPAFTLPLVGATF